MWDYLNQRSPNGDSKWYSLDLVGSLISNRDLMRFFRRLEDYAAYLEQNYEAIQQLFSEERCAETVKQLDKLGVELAQKMFPQLTPEQIRGIGK